MKNLVTLLSSSILLATALGMASTAQANSEYDNAAKTRLVHYTCSGNSSLEVTYGFNNANDPTYASATLDGSDRIMPINHARSDNMVTVFGNDNDFNVVTDRILLSNYNKVPVALVMHPDAEIVYQDCDVDWIRKLRG